MLAKEGAVPASEKAALHAELAPLNPDKMAAWQKKFMHDYAHTDVLGQWDKDVGAVYSFRHEPFNLKAQELHAVGLAPKTSYSATPQHELFAYGRGYVDYLAHIREMKAEKATPAEIRMYQDEHSKTVNGLPSYAAIEFSHRPLAQQTSDILRYQYHSWGTLSSTEKTIAGKTVDPRVTQAWTDYELLRKGHTLDVAQKLSVVKQIDRHYGLAGAFTKDYLFAREPLAARLKYLRLVTSSDNRQDWVGLLNFAIAYRKQMDAARVSHAFTQQSAREVWDQSVQQKLIPDLRKNAPRLWAELTQILRIDPRFLDALIR